MQFGELVAPSGDHDPEKCPFCPPEELKTYTTYSGDDNDSTKLTAIMIDPNTLAAKQSGSRPKDGKDGNQDKSEPQPLPPQLEELDIWIDTDQKTNFGVFSSEAHHLISGKQALKGHAFERWILVKGKEIIKGDTGYSINNADNGIHAPSIPEMHKGSWGKLHPETKEAAAFWIMDQTGIQFHKGPHNIADIENDPDEKFHMRYNKHIQKELDKMDKAMSAWAKICPVCTSSNEEGRPQPSARVNQALDNLSRYLKRRISRPSSSWDIFLSAFALRYHIEKGCPHDRCCKLE
jgi:hypothetical protein